jgi:hypothetical protein
MPLEPGLIAYAAWASLALATRRGPPRPPLVAALAPRPAMAAGWSLLALALLVAVLRLGPPIGVVAGLAQLMVAGAILILVLSWRPALALGLAAPALMGAALTAALG